MKQNSEETWVQLDEPFSRYEVSNLGRVKNRETGHILRGSQVGKYKQVALKHSGRSKFIYVHRLVAKSFLGTAPAPNFQVHHKNHNPSDNRASNLQWCSHIENARRKKPAVSTDNRSRPVIQKTLEGVVVAHHTRLTQTEYDPSAIVKVCKGKLETAYGFKWEYADEKPLKGEEWKILNLSGFQNPIGVSSKGRIRLPSGKITQGTLNDRGYRTVAIRIDSKKRTQRVHRLVAMAFNPLPKGRTDFDNFEIDHINCDRADNIAENLEWVSSRENLRRANKIPRQGPYNGHRKPVRAIPLDGEPPIEFSSVLEASNTLGLWRSGITRAATGKLSSTGGFRFEYVE